MTAEVLTAPAQFHFQTLYAGLTDFLHQRDGEIIARARPD